MFKNHSIMKVLTFVAMLAMFPDSGLCEDIRLETSSVFYGLGWMAEKLELGSQCHLQLINTTAAVDHQERWAVKLLDASGLPSSGLHWGNTFWLGSRDQCLSAGLEGYPHLNPAESAARIESQGTPPFEVAYYVANMFHNSDIQISVHWINETKVSLGLCLPSVCTESEVSDLLQKYFNADVLYQQRIYNMSLRVLEVKKTEKRFSMYDHPISVIFMIVSIIVVLLVIYGTWYDLQYHQPSLLNQNVEVEINSNVSNRNYNIPAEQNGHANGYHVENTLQKQAKHEINTMDSIALSFSIYSNSQSLFTMKARPGTLLPICGLRMYTTTFVMISHSFIFAMEFYKNKVYAFNVPNSYFGQFMINSSYTTDAFFCMSGFLMATGFFKTKEDPDLSSKWTHFKAYLMGVLKRFFRITPSYMYALGMTFVLAAWTHDTSSLYLNERNDVFCPQMWWTNLLYINNMYPEKQAMCMTWTYYLANEMQFFIIVTLLCHLSKKYFKLAASLMLAILVGSIITIAVTTYIVDYKPYVVNFFVMVETFYYTPWMRIGPYIIGTGYGYLYKKINGKLDIDSKYVSLMWVAMISIGVYLEFGYIDRNIPVVASMLYMSLSRNLWALMVGWVVLACLTGHGGIMTKILSQPLWVPLSQLTFWAYLINPIVTYTVGAYSDQSWEFTIMSVSINCAGLILLTFIFSIVMVLFIEMPCDKLVSMMFKSSIQRTRPSEEISMKTKVYYNGKINKME